MYPRRSSRGSPQYESHDRGLALVDRTPLAEHEFQSVRSALLVDVIRRPVDVVLGNSIHDLEMLEIAGQAIAVNPNPDLERIAHAKGWKIYWPEGTAS